MADLNKALYKVIVNEGGYVNDKDDAGGETYMGVCRKYYPKLRMWKKIDNLKNKKKTIKEINTILKKDEDIFEEVSGVYRDLYWNRICGDKIRSQSIAEELFDDAINCGVSSAIKKLQKALGVTADGIFGNKTLNAVNHGA